MKRIGVLTAGGDAPGMNPAIRAVVRTAISLGMKVVGIRRGYRGLHENDFFPMDSRSVSGIINLGGTILRSLRFPEFADKQVRRKAHQNLKAAGVEGLVAIGGDGTARGAHVFSGDSQFPVVVIPASIDNDVSGTDMTVGFDTAVNTAVDAIDRIRDTATSHERTFIIEVMGRYCGNLALEVGLACGAEIILVPEVTTDWEAVCAELEEETRKGKSSLLIVLAEGAGNAQDAAGILKKRFPEKEIRFSILGYIQRGGKPTYATRALATRFGVEAVRMLHRGRSPCLVGIQCGAIVPVPLRDVVAGKKPSPLENLDLARLMAI